MKKHIAFQFLVVSGILLVLTPAFAHKVIVFSWVEKGRIFVEGGFGSKRPAKDCAVVVMDDQGQIVYQGKTDDQGRHSFDLPQGDFKTLTVVLEAGPGHKGSWTLEAEELKQVEQKTVSHDKDRPDALTQGPSFVKIGGGIAFIFVLAWLGRRFTRKRGNA